MLTLSQAPSAARSTFEGVPAVALHAGALEAVFVPGAGMAAVSLRHEGEELLDRRAGLVAYAERGATMGIPFLHPWANRLDRWRHATPDLPRDEHGLPIHGVLPRAWDVRSMGAGELVASLDFAAAAFPFPHVAEQHVRLAPDALTITTTVRPSTSAPVPIAFGFHPYLVLPGVPRGAWMLELPARRHVLTDERGIPTGATEWQRAERAPLGRRTFDDGYDALGPVPRFAIAGGGRTVSVTMLRGYPVAQVFAPAGRHVVCLEPMTARVNALASGRGLRSVAPGGAFTASFEIRVSS
jgi:aldose 1-epimerase